MLASHNVSRGVLADSWPRFWTDLSDLGQIQTPGIQREVGEGWKGMLFSCLAIYIRGAVHWDDGISFGHGHSC